MPEDFHGTLEIVWKLRKVFKNVLTMTLKEGFM